MAAAQSGIPQTVRTPPPPARNVKNEINLDDIAAKTTEALIQWLQDIGTLPRSIPCPKCDVPMEFTANKLSIDGFLWTCRAPDHEAKELAKSQKKKKRPSSEYRCNTNCSLRTGTFFAKSKLTLHQIVKFVNLWMDNVSLLIIEKQVRISHKIAVDWSNFCREVVYDAMFERNEKLGGLDENGVPRVVEIDESKFGKRKYNKGHRVEGQWVFGGYERGTGRIFMVPVEDRSTKTLLPFIKEWILPHTVIISDCWRAYACLNNHEFQHYTVNHSIGFKDKETGAHTNAIESSWRHAKLVFPSCNRQKHFMAGYLAKYMFVKRIRYEGTDPTVAFLQQAGILYDPLKGDDESDDPRGPGFEDDNGDGEGTSGNGNGDEGTSGNGDEDEDDEGTNDGADAILDMGW